MKPLVYLLGLCVLFFSCSSGGENLDVNEIGNGRVISIDPFHGARIVSFSLDDYNGIVSSEKNGEYYGSTFWPAPQGDWNWPPPQAIDEGAYNKVGKSYLSTIDDNLQVSAGKEIKIIENEITEIRYTLKNHGDTILNIGGWEICRVRPGLSFFPLDTALNMKESNLPGVSILDSMVWYKYSHELHPVDGKKYFESGREGWLAHVGGGYLFLKTYADIDIDQLPPGHGEIELYTQGDDPAYTELEIHGPYMTLNPDEELEFIVRWKLYKIPTEIIIEEGSVSLLEWTRGLVEKQKL